MTRFAAHPDLFAPPPVPEAPLEEPLVALQAMLARLRGVAALPWPDAAGAMAEELRALGLARRAGPEGDVLAAAILVETERLLSATD